MKSAKCFAQVAMLVGVHFLVTHYSLSFGSLKSNVSAVWPPTGIALAAIILGGRRLWPGVFLGALLPTASVHFPSWWRWGALGAIQLEAVVGALFMRRRRDVDLGFERNADLVFWLFHVVPLATLISVTIGVASLYLGGVSRQRTPATPSDGRFGP